MEIKRFGLSTCIKLVFLSVPPDFKSDSWWMKYHWSFFPPMLHNRATSPHEVCDSPDKAAHYHTLSPKLEASSLIGQWNGLPVRVVIVTMPLDFKSTTLSLPNLLGRIKFGS
jgi:hypothetical protein